MNQYTGHGERRAQSIPQALDHLSKHRKNAGGHALGLKTDDENGDVDLVIGHDSLTALIKERQQDLGYKSYLFTNIMRQITTHNIPQDAKSQTHVRAQTEVRSQCKQAQKALVDTTKALANLTKETTPGRTYTRTPSRP